MKKEKLKLILSMTIFPILTLLIISLFWKNNFLTTTTLLSLSIIHLILLKHKKTAYLFIITALLGSMAEILAINFGAWNYSNPNIFKIPYWLPLVWGEASLFIQSVNIWLNKIK